MPADKPVTPPPTHHPARSYRDLERMVTPLPDSSHRPTPSEAAEAEIPKPVVVSGDEGAYPSADQVRAALVGLGGVDTSDLDVDVAGGTVTVSGSVARTRDREQILGALGRLAGVALVRDHLRVRLD
ncbi:MAG TPA: BON domain-containing protein [Kofleriaceae bacterium]|nr:BON domain-containing protein [Kofleriaceae bacterium]